MGCASSKDKEKSYANSHGVPDPNYANSHGVPPPMPKKKMEAALDEDITNIQVHVNKMNEAPAGDSTSQNDSGERAWLPFDQTPKHIQILGRVLDYSDHLPAHKVNDDENRVLVTALQELMELPCNSKCADCRADGPSWASVNLGIFVCMKCSGLHRSLGTHISKVRSVELDRWNEAQVQRIRDIGNEKSNEFWEAAMGDKVIPKQGDELLDFVTQKYAKRRWLRPR